MIKKIIILLLTCFLLVSCGSKKEDTSSLKTEENKETINDVIKEANIKESNYSSWIYSGEGNYSSSTAYKTIYISSENETLTSPDIYLITNTNYTISFDIAGIVDNTIIFELADDDRQYIKEEIEIKDTFNHYDFSFTCSNTSYNAKARFIVENNEDNVIQIDSFSIDSNTNKTLVKINQVGYLTNLSKKIVMSQNQGDYFNIYNQNNEIVYTSKISEVVFDKDSNEYLQYADFDDFKEKGTYYIKTELGSYSKSFVIDDNVYDDLAKDALNFIYTQRCGQDIEDEYLYHSACHTSQTKIFTYLGDYYIDTTGGWHDASDYGRYVQTSTKTIADLLCAYLYTDEKDENILSEARWGIEWILKLQKEDGSVYNKITSKLFADNVLPEKDKQELYAMWPWTLTAASFAGITGMAYKIYKDSDNEFAEKCLEAHQSAINYLQANKEMIQELNPDDFGTGEYRDDNENDERLFAYAVAYDISDDKDHYNLCKEVIDDGLSSDSKNYNCRIYAIITLLNCLKENDTLYKKAKKSLIDECDSLVETSNNNVYSYTYENYNWGSNSHLCDACNKLLLAYKLFGNEEYLKTASNALNYVMGLNCLDLCFIYGYGYSYPKTTHHRVSNVRGILPVGAMAGGVDQIMSEGTIGKYLSEDTPIAKRFVDSSDSYTNVEPAIYYNSALVLFLSLLESEN